MISPKASRSILRAAETALALSVPFLFMYLYFRNHHAYPRADGGEYAWDVASCYAHYKNGGLIELFDRIYFKRQWRAIIHSYVSAPLAILFSGNLLKAVHTHLAINLGVFLTFAYALTRGLLPPVSSIALVWLLGTLNYIVLDYTSYMSELSFLAAATGCLYYALRAVRRQECEVPHGFWPFLALSACTRPIETVLLLVPPSLLMFSSLYRRKAFTKKQAKVFGATLAATLLLLAAPALLVRRDLTGVETTLTLAACAATIALGACALWRARAAKSQIAGASFLMASVSFWYAPVVYRVFYWLYLSNFSSLATNQGGRQDSSYFQYADLILNSLSFTTLKPLFAFALFMAAAQAATHLFLNRKKSAAKLSPHHKTEWAIWTSVIFFQFAIAFFSHNGDPRYYQLSGLALTGIAVYACLRPRFPYVLVSFLPFLFFLFVQLFSFYQTLYPATRPDRFDRWSWIAATYPLPHRETDACIPMTVALEKSGLLPKKRFSDAETKIAFIQVLGDKHGSLENPLIDQWTASVCALERGLHWHYLQLNFGEITSFKELGNIGNNRYDYVLVAFSAVDGKIQSSLTTLGIKSSEQLLMVLRKTFNVDASSKAEIIRVPYEPPMRTFEIVALKLSWH